MNNMLSDPERPYIDCDVSQMIILANLSHSIERTNEAENKTSSLALQYPSSHDAAEDLLALLKLLDAVREECSLALCGRGLGDHALDFRIGHVDGDQWREDIV